MISGKILLKQIDDLTRKNHPYLRKEDELYYLGEYAVGGLSDYSEMNKLIINYKKRVERKGQSDWGYKEQAISKVAANFRETIFNTVKLSERAQFATFVPVPPSSHKDSVDYDNRNHQMLKHMAPKGDVRELLIQKTSRPPLHAQKTSPREFEDLLNNYMLNKDFTNLSPKELWLFDDILTKGTHFRAASEFLKLHYPLIPIVGFFIARTVSREASSKKEQNSNVTDAIDEIKSLRTESARGPNLSVKQSIQEGRK